MSQLHFKLKNGSNKYCGYKNINPYIVWVISLNIDNYKKKGPQLAWTNFIKKFYDYIKILIYWTYVHIKHNIYNYKISPTLDTRFKICIGDLLQHIVTILFFTPTINKILNSHSIRQNSITIYDFLPIERL